MQDRKVCGLVVRRHRHLLGLMTVMGSVALTVALACLYTAISFEGDTPFILALILLSTALFIWSVFGFFTCCGKGGCRTNSRWLVFAMLLNVVMLCGCGLGSAWGIFYPRFVSLTGDAVEVASPGGATSEVLAGASAIKFVAGSGAAAETGLMSGRSDSYKKNKADIEVCSALAPVSFHGDEGTAARPYGSGFLAACQVSGLCEEGGLEACRELLARPMPGGTVLGSDAMPYVMLTSTGPTWKREDFDGPLENFTLDHPSIPLDKGSVVLMRPYDLAAYEEELEEGMLASAVSFVLGSALLAAACYWGMYPCTVRCCFGGGPARHPCLGPNVEEEEEERGGVGSGYLDDSD